MTNPRCIRINVCHGSGIWHKADEPLWHQAALAGVQADYPSSVSCPVDCQRLDTPHYVIGIYLCDSEEMIALNQRYRGLHTPTNVLSFWDEQAQRAWQENREGLWQLGDVVLADSVVQKEALECGLPLRVYACRLIIHGVLHLLGYDHNDDEEAQAMNRQETHAMQWMARNDVLVA